MPKYCFNCISVVSYSMLYTNNSTVRVSKLSIYFSCFIISSPILLHFCLAAGLGLEYWTSDSSLSLSESEIKSAQFTSSSVYLVAILFIGSVWLIFLTFDLFSMALIIFD